MISVFVPSSRRVVNGGGGATIISEVGDHYMLDAKGSASRISSRIHHLLGPEEKVLRPELIEEVLASFSERHSAARAQLDRFLWEHVGWTAYSGYHSMEHGPTGAPLHVAC